jgi:hypothetical protein
MSGEKSFVHPDIPERLRFRDRMNLSEPLTSEAAPKRHVEEVLGQGGLCVVGVDPSSPAEIDEHLAGLEKVAEEAYADPARWAITWRAYLKKHGHQE